MTDKKKILIVDDKPENLKLLQGLLESDYKLFLVPNGIVGIEVARKQQPDLILLDVVMPGADGYEICRRLKAEPALCEIPVIFLTANRNPEDEEKGLGLGAVDYISKPFSPAILCRRINNHLELKMNRDLLKQQNENLEQIVLERTVQMQELQDVVMVSMGTLAESRDSDTGNHIRRIQLYIKILADELKTYPRFNQYLKPEVITSLNKASPLHDIGKVAVPDSILLKPGKLTDDEFEIMKLHTLHGLRAIEAAEKIILNKYDFLRISKEIIYSHHEHWDGKGYPQGLEGDAIPVCARIMALADVYDALVSKRVYKRAFGHEEARDIIVGGKGSHFDPDIVDAFLVLEKEFQSISNEYRDRP